MITIPLLEQFLKVRKRTEEICEPLIPEDFVIQVAYYGSPLKWQLGHTSWFFEEMILKKYEPSFAYYDDRYPYLFNSYYNNLGERTSREERGLLSRPSVDEVYAYRRNITQRVQSLLEREIREEVLTLVELGLNHEQQHQELMITDLKLMLSYNPIKPVYKEGVVLVEGTSSEKGWVKVPEGNYSVGHHGEGFHYDNELAPHTVFLHDFEISTSLVTNAAYMEFMEAGGYEDFNLWLDEGWAWRCEHKIDSPMYWERKNGAWEYFTFSGMRPVDPDAEVCHVSYYEAMAFAEWKGMRLPTEAEWEIASDRFRWGSRWEWTNSAYLPYPGFKKPDGAIGEYNGKFMVNQMVLRGASVATAAGHSRRTYRNFFHPHFQWQFSGIRLVK